MVFGYDEDGGFAGRGCAHCQWVEQDWRVPDGDEERSRVNAEMSQEAHERFCNS